MAIERHLDAKKRILVSLFGADGGYTGFKNIIYNLVSEGKVLTTPEANKIDFGPMQKFMFFGEADEDGLILVKFSTELAYKSEEFAEARDKEIVRLREEVRDTESKLLCLKIFINNLSK